MQVHSGDSREAVRSRLSIQWERQGGLGLGSQAID